MDDHRSRTARCLALLIPLFAAAGLSARTDAPSEAPPPAEPPAQAAPAPRPAEGVRVAPVDRPSKGPGADQRPGTGVLLAEGTHIANRRGWLERLGNGDWLFHFEEDPSLEPLATMMLQPCQRLTEIVRIVEARPERVVFTLSGRIYVYAGRNYLLPTTFATATTQQQEDAEESTRAVRDPALDTANPSVEQLVADVDDATRPAENPRGAAPTAAPADGAPKLRREGTAIVSQTGRLSRGARNWVFTVDNDPDAKPGDDEAAPLEILPCLNLSEMERLYERHGQNLRFIISGTVFTFKDRNMLLPSMYVVDIDRDGNLTSAQ